MRNYGKLQTACGGNFFQGCAAVLVVCLPLCFHLLFSSLSFRSAEICLMVVELALLKESATPLALNFGFIHLLPVAALQCLVRGEYHHASDKDLVIHQVTEHLLLVVSIEQAHFDATFDLSDLSESEGCWGNSA